ncbi:MAG TPA: hypothetical protein GXZ64_00540 [Clostridiaceae bacterium]|nr:hypothetical protein [Clostridiaceae bacterium]
MFRRASQTALLIFLILALAGCIGAPLSTKPTVTRPAVTAVEAGTGDEQIETIFSLIRNAQWQVLQNWLTFDTSRNVTFSDIVDRQAKIHEKLGVESVDLTGVRKLERASDKNIAVYEAEMVFETRYGKMQRPLTLTFLKDVTENRWELDWTPALIFPGLTEENDILIETAHGKRGQIYDRHLIPLAAEGDQFTVGAVAGAYLAESNAAVAELLGMDADRIETIMAQSWIRSGMFVPLKSMMSLSPAQMEKLPQLGLTVRRSSARVYPEAETLAHLIGYVGEVTADDIENGGGYYRAGDMIGKRGLEALYENRLRPQLGITVFLSGSERTVLYEQQAADGEDIVLTIDSRLQRKLYDLMADDEGQAVAVHPESGDILALVSVPSFDPNLFVGGISSETYQALLDNPKTPMLNRFQLRYAPGSTAKILTYMAGYNLGIVNDQTIKTITTKSWQPGPAWGGYEVKRLIEYNEPQNPQQALVISDNIFFAQIAVEAGAEAFLNEWQGFGIGEDVPVDYPFYRSQVSNDNTFDNEVLLADAAYGQGEFQITSLQLASIASGAVTGNIMKPRLLLDDQPEPWKTDIASESTRHSLLTAMRQTIEITHVNSVERPFARLAGKSGTAEVAFDQTLQTQGIDSWFVGFDMDNPTLMLAVQVQNIQRRDDGVSAPQRFGEAFEIIYEGGETPYQPDP